eukprot:TRINITY_DN16596_c0_g1_i1.p2 TRINITY_DN16596_c0_g1~~TRINITY_DN16596_c0_g1_i1.p2  ORF type:complete len:118 (-),score=33.80 TRINITY_DN16596_c0_g1_i1:21-374(-)
MCIRDRTFTNRAADELRERINSSDVFVGTLHGLATAILRANNVEFSVVDEAERAELVRGAAAEEGQEVKASRAVRWLEGEAPAGVAARYERTLSSICLLYTSPSPRDRTRSRMPSSA